jgi:hypothetical protein
MALTVGAIAGANLVAGAATDHQAGSRSRQPVEIG